MPGLQSVVPMFCVLLLVAGSGTGVAGESSRPPLDETHLDFSTNIAVTLEQARETGKPVVVSFIAAWCPICREMGNTFRDPSIVAYSDRFLWVTVDIDRELSIARAYRIDAVPMVLMLNPGGEVRGTLVGLYGPAEFGDQLRHFADNLDRGPEPELASPETETHRPKSELIWRPNGYRGKGICFSHVGYGPMRLYSQSPFQSLRMGIRPRTPSTLGAGSREVSVTSTWVNIWAPDEAPGDPSNTYFLDFEMLQVSTALAYGITDTVEIEGEIQDRSRFGGTMDGFVQGFHDLFGIEQNGRDLVPRDEFTVGLAPPGGTAVSLNSGDRGSFSRTLQLSLQHNVTCGGYRMPAFSYSLTTRLETLDGDLSGDSDLDFGVSVAVARRFGPVYLYGTLGYAWFGQANFRGIPLEDKQFSSLATMEWRFRPAMSLLLQYLYTGGVIDDFGPFSKASNEITVGFKWEVRDRGIIELGLIENIVEFDNSPDFGIHLGFSQRF